MIPPRPTPKDIIPRPNPEGHRALANVLRSLADGYPADDLVADEIEASALRRVADRIDMLANIEQKPN